MDHLPMGDKTELSDDEFYNRVHEISTLTSLLKLTGDSNAPDILLTGIRGVGKTVFLKKLKKLLDDDFLVVYVDFSRAECYQKENMSVEGLMQHYYKELMSEASNKNLNTLTKKITKFFKTNDFKLKDWGSGIPLPVVDSKVNSEELVNFVMDLPQQLFNENSDKIGGIIVFIDEFQIIKELDNYLEGFLWKFRSFIQEQSCVAYVLSGSMSLQDKLIAEIASRGGVFGGRLITFHLDPFTPVTLRKYLSENASNLLLSDDAFNKFYECTSGIPSLVNFLGRLLPRDRVLSVSDVEDDFLDAISVLSIQLISIWSNLTTREQNIIISLLDGPLKRVDIARFLDVTTGSLSHSLNTLLNLSLIDFNDGLYEISEPMLALWLKLEYEKKGIYPYRRI